MTESLVTTGVQQDAGQVQTQETTVEDVQDTKEQVVSAPDKYEFTFPEGMEVDEELLNEFIPLAKEAKLPKDTAQKYVNLFTKAVTKIEERQSEAWEQLQEGWINGAKSDKEYGGLNFDANVAVARKAVDKFGTKELKDMLDATGAGNHPELLRFMYRVGKAISEDDMKAGQSKGPAPTDLAHRIYPSMN